MQTVVRKQKLLGREARVRPRSRPIPCREHKDGCPRFAQCILSQLLESSRHSCFCFAQVQATPSSAPHILPTFDPDQLSAPASRAPSENLEDVEGGVTSAAAAADAVVDADTSSGADAPQLALLFGAPTSAAQQTLWDVYASALTQVLVRRGETRPVVCSLSLLGGAGPEDGEGEDEEEKEGERLKATIKALESLL